MPLDLVTVPCLNDNYAYLLHEPKSGAVAVIDVPEAAPIQAALAERGWSLSDILITHHHHDHVGDVDKLRAATGARVTGAAADDHRLPQLDNAVLAGDVIELGGETAMILDASGHTLGHIAYHFPKSGILCSGDSLMALGCGRLFEGTPAQMWETLSSFAQLPPETLICSGHEYSQANGLFALTIEPENAALQTRCQAIETARAKDLPTVPVSLGEELATNPFLRAGEASVKAALGLENASDTEVFAQIRRQKDSF
ncbi:MAG: hydroxyacylglutathione hydrolase [Mangrovicoccus sp.]|nr:hydroxyacylglutathione hydrolase [Mangrovicoccus sp.]